MSIPQNTWPKKGRRDTLHPVLQRFRNEGNWIAIAPSTVKELIRLWLESGQEVTPEVATADLLYWIDQGGKLPSYRFFAGRWKWATRKTYLLFAEIGIYTTSEVTRRAQIARSNSGADTKQQKSSDEATEQDLRSGNEAIPLEIPKSDQNSEAEPEQDNTIAEAKTERIQSGNEANPKPIYIPDPEEKKIKIDSSGVRAPSAHEGKPTKNNSRRKNQRPANDEDIRLAALLHELNLQEDPLRPAPNMTTWAEQFNRLHRLDQRPYEEIEKVLRWAKADGFWSSNIQSAKKFRAHYPTLRAKSAAHWNHGSNTDQRNNYRAGFWPSKSPDSVPHMRSGD